MPAPGIRAAHFACEPDLQSQVAGRSGRRDVMIQLWVRATVEGALTASPG